MAEDERKERKAKTQRAEYFCGIGDQPCGVLGMKSELCAHHRGSCKLRNQTEDNGGNKCAHEQVTEETGLGRINPG